MAAAAFASRVKRWSLVVSSRLEASRITSAWTTFTATRTPEVSSIAS